MHVLKTLCWLFHTWLSDKHHIQTNHCLLDCFFSLHLASHLVYKQFQYKHVEIGIFDIAIAVSSRCVCFLVVDEKNCRGLYFFFLKQILFRFLIKVLYLLQILCGWRDLELQHPRTTKRFTQLVVPSWVAVEAEPWCVKASWRPTMTSWLSPYDLPHMSRKSPPFLGRLGLPLALSWRNTAPVTCLWCSPSKKDDEISLYFDGSMEYRELCEIDPDFFLFFIHYFSFSSVTF